MSQTTPSGADVLARMLDIEERLVREKLFGAATAQHQLRTAVAALIARNAELEAALAEESEQLSACREDWQRVCDTIEPGVHFDPDEVIAKVSDRDAIAAENKALREGSNRLEFLRMRFGVLAAVAMEGGNIERAAAIRQCIDEIENEDD